ncbi:hypothetical protein [Microbacterium sp. A93]|uniref:hypothetical protein n=1 Tax=Microbacterium sp. A93 TaxID=3450716 RepID=UPI003F41B7DA
MRTALSILLAALAGLLAALSLVGARAEALVHTPEPLQRIAGPMSEDPGLRAALPDEVGGIVSEQWPDAVPSFLQDSFSDLVSAAADGLVTDERFPAVWAETLEQTRTDWVGRLAAIHQDEGSPGGGGGPDPEAGTLHLQLTPIIGLGVDRLAASAETLPGGSVIARAVREGGDRIVSGAGTGTGTGTGPDGGASPLAVDLTVPDPDAVPMDAVAWTVHHLYRWPWLAGTSAVLLLLALMAAPRRRKGTPLFVAGITALAVGAAGRWALGRLGPAADMEGLARAAAASLLDGIRGYAMPDTLLLMVGGGTVAVLGLITVLVSGLRPLSARRSGPPAH